jgi:hypothetical protein
VVESFRDRFSHQAILFSPAMSITGLTLVAVTKDRCLRAEISPTTTSTATRREMGEAT